MYFPVAKDLSRADRILEAAQDAFAHVESVSAEYTFPLTRDQVQLIEQTYHGELPEFLTIVSRSRGEYSHYWRGVIYRASNG